MSMSTCQICAREIRASKGLIAHHGYKRPGGGYQTGSCFGARYLPYEVSCDRLPFAINYFQNFIVTQKSYLENFLKNPPSTLTRRSFRLHGKEETYTKPQNFDPNNRLYAYSTSQMYEIEFESRRFNVTSSIEAAERELKFLKERLANWVKKEERL